MSNLRNYFCLKKIICSKIDKEKNLESALRHLMNIEDLKENHFCHKMVIRNFKHYFKDDHFLKDTLLCTIENKTKQFMTYLELSSNRGPENDNNMSIFVNLLLFENCELYVEYKLTLLSEDDECCFSIICSNRIHESGKHVWQNNFDSSCIDKILESLVEGKVIILCEIVAIPTKSFKVNKILFKNNENQIINILNKNFNMNEISIIENKFNAHPGVIYSQEFKWTIDNFENIYSDEWIHDLMSTNLGSSNFQSVSNEDHQFKLLLCPNGSQDEFRNNISIYLARFLPNNVDANVQLKISIIDKSQQKVNTKSLQCTFNEKKHLWGFGEYISVQQLLDRSNGLLCDDTLSLLCEVIGDGDEQIYGNTPTLFKVSDYLNLKPRVIESLAYKWSIENFGYLNRDEWRIERIESNKIHSNYNENNQFNLRLDINEDRDKPKNNLSISLCYFSPENVNANVRWKISIIDKKGDKFNTRAMQCIFNEKMNVQKIIEYVSLFQLLDYSNGLLNANQLALLCEILILENDVQRFTEFDPIESARHIILELNQSLNSVHLSKCAHKWTIHNFDCALAEESIGEELISCAFPSSSSQNCQFILFLVPKGHNEGSPNYVSLHINVILFKRIQLLLQYKIFLVNSNGNKLKLKGEELYIDKSGSIEANKFLSHDDLRQQLLNDNSFTLYCEINVIENWTQTSLPKTNSNEYLFTLSKLKLDEDEVTETVTNVKAKNIKFEHTWEIENCGETSEKETNSLFTIHPTGSYIESPSFSPPNHSTTNQHRFYLRMYPNGIDEESKEYVSIRFGIDSQQVTCQLKISLIEKPGLNLSIKCNTKKSDKCRLIGNHTFDFKEFISHSDLFNPADALIKDNKLTVHCEIELDDEDKIVYIQNNKNEVLNLIEQTNLIDMETLPTIPPTLALTPTITSTFNPSLTPTQSITQVTLHTRHWTIDNFDLYFKSLQDIDQSSYLELPIFLQINNKQLQFIVKLFSKNSHSFMCFDCIFNKNPNTTTIVNISFYNTNDKKCFTRLFTAETWPKYLSGNWEDIQVELNLTNQLKLSVEYTICTHYSSPTELSHLDQFSLDQFTSPWEVKRLCDVPTHSRALTSIPVESCQFEWEIPEFSGSQKSLQSSTFCLDKIQFYLRMNQRSQDKISIYLCLEKSVDKENKTFMKITILDKDGEEFYSQEKFIKLYEVEPEYECVEPFEEDFFSGDVLGQEDTLRMSCEWKLIGDSIRTNEIVKPIPKVLPNLNSLLTNREPSDLIFQFSDGNQLHAHRSILCYRSQVFYGMFQHDSIEAQQGQVDITDINIKAFEQMLHYMYTGEAELNQQCTFDLLIAADKYDVIELKTHCEDWLYTNLSIETVTDCLILSDQIGERLKKKSIEYFHKNAKELEKAGFLKELNQKKPELFIEIYMNLIDQSINEESDMK